jgi:hypothetical protein
MLAVNPQIVVGMFVGVVNPVNANPVTCPLLVKILLKKARQRMIFVGSKCFMLIDLQLINACMRLRLPDKLNYVYFC